MRRKIHVTSSSSSTWSKNYQYWTLGDISDSSELILPYEYHHTIPLLPSSRYVFLWYHSLKTLLLLRTPKNRILCSKRSSKILIWVILKRFRWNVFKDEFFSSSLKIGKIGLIFLDVFLWWVQVILLIFIYISLN